MCGVPVHPRIAYLYDPHSKKKGFPLWRFCEQTDGLSRRSAECAALKAVCRREGPVAPSFTPRNAHSRRCPADAFGGTIIYSASERRRGAFRTGGGLGPDIPPAELRVTKEAEGGVAAELARLGPREVLLPEKLFPTWSTVVDEAGPPRPRFR